MKYELNSGDSEKSLNHKENIVWACDTESTYSEKICRTYVNTCVCPFKPVKNSALQWTTLGPFKRVAPAALICTVSRFLQIGATAVV